DATACRGAKRHSWHGFAPARYCFFSTIKKYLFSLVEENSFGRSVGSPRSAKQRVTVPFSTLTIPSTGLPASGPLFGVRSIAVGFCPGPTTIVPDWSSSFSPFLHRIVSASPSLTTAETALPASSGPGLPPLVIAVGV